MTLAGRSLLLRLMFSVMLLLSVGTTALVVLAFNGMVPAIDPQVELRQLPAAGAALAASLAGLFSSALYLRLFRRTPSLAVFFVIWFYLAMVPDGLKLFQLILPYSSWPQLAPVVSRLGLLAHLLGVMALFAAGLYAGGVRMQRHGTAIFIAGLIALGLSWSIPIDTATLPPHLVFNAGIRSSMRVTIILFLVLAVLNFVQAGVSAGGARRYGTAATVAALAVGRELLFYSVDLMVLGAGLALFVTGMVVFAVLNYRDFLLS